MKYTNKIMILFLFMLTTLGRDISAYNYTITNLTGQDVKLKLHPFQKKLELLKAYDTKIFSFKGVKIGICLSKIMCSSFDEELDRWIGEMTAPIKSINRELFESTKHAIVKFNKSVKKVGKLAALAGSEGVVLSLAIDSLADVVEAGTDIWGASLCRNRDFIIVLDDLILPGGRPLVIGGKHMLAPYALVSP